MSSRTDARPNADDEADANEHEWRSQKRAAEHRSEIMEWQAHESGSNEDADTGKGGVEIEPR